MHHVDNSYQNLFGTELHLRLRFTTFDVTSGPTTTSGLSKIIKTCQTGVSIDRKLCHGKNNDDVIFWS